MVKKFILNFLKISRANIQIASLPTAVLGILLGITSLEMLLSQYILAYIVLFFTILTFSCNLNCLCDLKVDGKYKTYLSNAVKSMGIKNVKIILVLELLLISFLIAYLFQGGYFITALLSILGLFFGISYSMEPLRIKKRGILSPVPVLVGLYTLPILAGWFLFNYSLPLHFLLFVAGYALMNEGFTLVNTCEDYSEDREEGIKTWAHVFGLKKTLLLAFLFSTAGFLCLAPFLFGAKSLSSISYLMLIILSLGISHASKEVYLVNKGKDLEEAAKKYAPKMRIWFMMTRYPLLFTALSLFL